MPRFFLSTASFALLSVFLLAQTGIAVFKHSCKLKGEKTFIFVKPENICCSVHTSSDEKCHTLQNSACCLESTKIYKLSADFSLDFAFSFDFVAHQPLSSIFELFFLAYPSENLLFPIQFANPPPPKRYGKNLLPLIGSYLI